MCIRHGDDAKVPVARLDPRSCDTAAKMMCLGRSVRGLAAAALVASIACDSPGTPPAEPPPETMPASKQPPGNTKPPADVSAAAVGIQEGSGKDASVLPDPKYVPIDGKYQFSKDMFDDRIPVWSRVLGPFKGRADLGYLEVGVFEGKSVVWMLENILTDPSSHVTAVDIFPGELKSTFLRNVELAGRTEAVTAIEGLSSVELRKLPLQDYDIIYIDGSHTADDVLADAVLAWGLLKPGGVMIFDDFLWVGRGGGNLLPEELRPALGVSSFIAAYRNEIEVLENGYQVLLRRVENPCRSKHYCSPIGHLRYQWRERKLLDTKGEEQSLTPAELEAIETVASSREFGEAGYRLPADPKTKALLERLGVTLRPVVSPLGDRDRQDLLGVGMRGAPAQPAAK